MRIFWGFVLIVLGALFLGVNLGWWTLVVWHNLWQLWPLILVALGLRALIPTDRLYFLILLFLLVAGFALATSLPDRRFDYHKLFTEEHFTNEHFFSSRALSGESATFDQAIDVTSADTLLADLGGQYEVTMTGDDSSAIKVKLTGPKELIDDISLVRKGSEVKLAQAPSPFNWNAQLITGTITLPKSLAIELRISSSTKVEADNLTGPLEVKASGASQLTSTNSSALNPTLDLSGSSIINLDQCQGSARFETSGAAKLSAKSCSLTELTVQASGASQVTVSAGSVTDLTTKASGAAKVRVPTPTGKIDSSDSGAARLEYSQS